MPVADQRHSRTRNGSGRPPAFRRVKANHGSFRKRDTPRGGTAPNGQSVDAVGRPDVVVEPVAEPAIETVLEPVGEVGIERITLRQRAAGRVSRGSEQA